MVWSGKLTEQAGLPILTGTGMHITQMLNCLGQTCKIQHIREGFPKKWKTRSTWLNCALRDNKAMFWVSIGHYEAVADVNWQGWTGKLFFSRGGARPKIYGAGRSGEPPPPSFSAGCCNIVPSLVSSIGES